MNNHSTAATADLPIKSEDNGSATVDVKVKLEPDEIMNDTAAETTVDHDAIAALSQAMKLDEEQQQSQRLPVIKKEEIEEKDEVKVDDDNKVNAAATDYSQVEVGANNTLLGTTPRATAADATSEKRTRSKLPPTFSTTVTSTTELAVGKPILVSTHGNFPSVGSQLGPLFCLGRLGKGTFCSIHKCLQLYYYLNSSSQPQQQQSQQQQQQPPHRIVAAKVELETFQNSGVLDGEAVVLQHLDVSLPAGTVPKYVGYYKTATPSTTDMSSSSSSLPSQSQQQQQQQQQQQYGTAATTAAAACSAIVMEYLQGEDMHQLRDRVVFGRPSRRMALADAVYLTADVMLPMLQRMHQVGIVHRDVKPSNVVRCGNTGTDRRFCMVDFGLSKSLVVSRESSLADYEHAWHGTSWIRPPPSSSTTTTTTTTTSGPGVSGGGTTSNSNTTANNNMVASMNSQSLPELPPPEASILQSSSSNGHHQDNDITTTANKPATVAYLRKERPTAEFRGTSMYASLRVHQSKDYCPRDDMWGLLYVFCDLASGGLPWMSHAANRDRDACQKLKEIVHGEATRNGANGNEQPTPIDETHQLLMGDLYHLAKYKRDHSKMKGNDANETPPLPEPLAMSRDEHKVQLLRTAFAHLATLQFWDIPDYDLIQSCIKGFVDGPSSTTDDPIAPISWEHFPSKPSAKYRRSESASSSTAAALLRKRVPTWNLSGPDSDSLDEDLFDEAESSSNDGESGSSLPLEGDDADMARLPLEFRFRVAQMEYNTFHCSSCPLHLALRDFMNVALPLLHGEWDSRTFEKGNHRTNNDGFRRDLYLKLLDKCLKCAEQFGYFTDKSWLYENVATDEPSSEVNPPALKRRKIVATSTRESRKRGTDVVTIANVILGLTIAKGAEEKKNLAPPPRLSFGSGFGMM